MKSNIVRYWFMIIVIAVTGNPLRAQSIEELLALAVKENPELNALQLEYEAALLKGPQVSQLPDPQIGFGAPAMRPETRLGAQAFGISASQMFPWFGTLKAKEDVVLTMAESKYERIMATRLDLEYKIRIAYDQLWSLDEQQDVIRDNIRIYQSLEEVSTSKVESGKTTLSDVLRIQVKIQDLEKELELIDNRKLKYFARINAIIKRPATDTIEIVNQLDSLVYLPPDFNELLLKIADNHPVINQLDWSIEASLKEQEVNRLSGMPTMGLGLDYSLVAPRTDAMPDMNGKDILIPKIMISIPFNRKKYKAKDQEELLTQQALELRKEDVINKYEQLLEEYRADFEDADLRLELYRQQTKTLRSSQDILLDYYSSHGNRFEEILQVQDQLVRYELSTISAIAQKHIALAGMDHLTKF